MKKFAFPQISSSMFVVAIVIGVLFFNNDDNFSKSSVAMQQIEDCIETMSGLNILPAELIDVEIGQRGYMQTGDERYLLSSVTAIKEVNKSLASIQLMVNKHPELAQINGLMVHNIAKKFADFEIFVEMRKVGKLDPWKNAISTDIDKQKMEVVGVQILQLRNICEAKIIAARNQIHSTLLISRIGIALLAMTVLLAFYLYATQNKKLVETTRREKDALQRERDQIESLVKERTSNLEKLATHLQNMREDERGDLARALHDEFGALLTAAKLDIARLKTQIASSLPDAELRFTHLTSTLNSIIVMTRNIVENLRPSSLSHLGLKTSLEILAREFENQHDLSIAVDFDSVELVGNAQLAIYRMVQESLTNISKYANARNVVLSMHDLDSYVLLQVKDDGIGFDKTKIEGTHHGLLGMQHRVEALGGKLTITSMPGYGTHILATFLKKEH
jgi:signal transduction histidine kinase